MGLPPGETAPGGVNGPGSTEDAGGTEGTGTLAAPWRPVVPHARPATGDPRVDDAVARLDDLDGLPLAEHLAVFEYVHERLTEALGDLDVHASAGAGDQSHAPGAPGG
jgi:hypothetical protein